MAKVPCLFLLVLDLVVVGVAICGAEIRFPVLEANLTISNVKPHKGQD